VFAIAFDLTVKEVTKHHPKECCRCLCGYWRNLGGVWIPNGCHGRPNGFTLVSTLCQRRAGLPSGAMVQFHRPGEASGYKKMSGPCFLSHKYPDQAAARSSSINGLQAGSALPTRQNDAFCLVDSHYQL